MRLTIKIKGVLYLQTNEGNHIYNKQNRTSRNFEALANILKAQLLLKLLILMLTNYVVLWSELLDAIKRQYTFEPIMTCNVEIGTAEANQGNWWKLQRNTELFSIRTCSYRTYEDRFAGFRC